MRLLRTPTFWLLAATAVLTILAPEERRLGSVARLIYLHGALVWVAFVLLGLTAVLAMVALFREGLYGWARGVFTTTVGVLLVNVVLVPIITKLTWGVAFAWREPRVILLFFLTAFALGIHLLLDSVDSRIWSTLFLCLPALAVAAFLTWAPRMLHPTNPIGTSGSLTIKGFSLAIFLTALAAALGAAGELGKGFRVDRAKD